MESPPDSTAVFRMRKDFDAFLSGNGSRSEQSIRIDLDAEIFSNSKTKKSLQPTPAESIKLILEKEKEEKLKRAELLSAQSKIVELETQLSVTKTSNKRARIEYEKDIRSVKCEKEREADKISELRSKIGQLTELERMARAELAEGQKDWNAARGVLEGKLRAVERENLNLEDELEKEKQESWQKVMEEKMEADRCRSQVELIQLQIEENRQILGLRDERVAEMEEQLADAESLQEKIKTAEDRIKELEDQISLQAEDAAVTRAFRADIDKVPELEKEVKRLRTENEYWSLEKQNTLLLKEQLISLQRKLEAAEKRCEGVTEMEVELEDLKARLQRWEAMDTSGSRKPQSPSALSRRVSELQTAQALNLQEKGELQSNISLLEVRQLEAREQHQKSQRDLAGQTLCVQQHSELIKRLRRKLLLVSKERDSFKRILDAYESEMTLPIQTGSRTAELEEVLAGFQQHNTDLEAQLEQVSEQYRQAEARRLQLEQQCQSSEPVSSSSVKADLDKVAQLQLRILELEQEVAKVSEEKEVLEMRIEQRHLQGDYNPTETKVLHFSLNPAATAQRRRQQEVERLSEENERLTARVQLLEQAGGPVEDLTLQVDKQLETVPESKVIDELKQQLAKEELRKKRLMEAFQKTSQEFRETCYQLLGYKIDMPCTGQYRLASMYSESSHDYLLFKQGQSGEIQMLETEFSERQQDKLETYLQNRDSIPALLSAITLDLFNQQTINMG